MDKANSAAKSEIIHWNISSSDDETESKSHINSVLCVKRKEDMKRFEETEDCFILDFDPFDSVDISTLTLASEKFNEDGIAILAEKGQVACRDYPHPRHLCQKFPFATTPHLNYCDKCYCYLCDTVAPCESWALSEVGHCHATGDGVWKLLKRKLNKKSQLK